jgi:hypothetical protein
MQTILLGLVEFDSETAISNNPFFFQNGAIPRFPSSRDCFTDLQRLETQQTFASKTIGIGNFGP